MTTANINDRIDANTINAARDAAPALKIRPLHLITPGIYDAVCPETGELIDAGRIIGTPVAARTLAALAGRLIVLVNQQTGENFA